MYRLRHHIDKIITYTVKPFPDKPTDAVRTRGKQTIGIAAQNGIRILFTADFFLRFFLSQIAKTVFYDYIPQDYFPFVTGTYVSMFAI